MSATPGTIERCPIHPTADPEVVVINVIRSHQSSHPTRHLTKLRCPICG